MSSRVRPPLPYKTARRRMGDRTRNPYTVGCSGNTGTPGNAYQISGALPGAYAITLDTGITGVEVAALLMLVAQVVEELDSSDARSTPSHRQNIFKTTKALFDKIKELDSPEKLGKAASLHGNYLVQGSQSMVADMNSHGRQKPLEKIGRRLGQGAANAINAFASPNNASKENQYGVVRSV